MEILKIHVVNGANVFTFSTVSIVLFLINVYLPFNVTAK